MTQPGGYPKSVCVYCASSRDAGAEYYDAARRLGTHLATSSVTIYYGGGRVGSMGHLADAALAAGGQVIGVLPEFMQERELGHEGLTELHVVRDMHERKRLMMDNADAAIALPGGCGTLEELLEAITWRRLGLFGGPVALVNTKGFYNSCRDLLERCVADNFIPSKHQGIWTIVDEPEEALQVLRDVRS